MPPAKKAAKKAPAKSANKHDPARDLRRAYEHRGRVEALRPSLGKHTAEVDALMQLAERELAGSHMKDAADLLRAAEHLSFGHLASRDGDDDVDAALPGAAEEEFQHKLEKAQEHWEESEALTAVYQNTLDGAQRAFDDGAYRRALELVRAAEALAHVHLHDAAAAGRKALQA